LNRALFERFRIVLAPLVLELIFAWGLPLAVPMLAASQEALSQPTAALHAPSSGKSSPLGPAELPEAVTMLLAGGVLMAFGLMRRKRRAGKASDPR
jgi:hypothetical protein